LAQALGDPSILVRLAALQCLERMGTNALPALPALEKASTDPKFAVRETAKRLTAQLKATISLAPVSANSNSR
jgi:HEAT repeat protein